MKNIYKHLLILLLFTSSGIQFVMGQSTNLAPSATATAYTRDPNGLYQWSKINDLSYASCGRQEAFVWTSTYGIDGTEYMQWEWTSAKTVGKITFHNAWNNTRNLTACVLQYWNGSGWSNWATLNIAQACVDSAKFTPVTTTKIRLTDFKMTASGQLSNPSWREIEVWSASTKKDDVGITSITMPLCSPTLIVGYTNLGTNVIDSAKINWSVNGTLQTQNRYNTSQKPGGGSTVTLAPDYNFVDGATYSLKVWTSLPNNKADSVPTNDTSKLTFKYIGPAGTPSVKDVVKCGPGRAPLKATTVNAGDSIVWYDAATKGNLVARGKNTLSPPLFLGTNTFYAQGFKMGSPSKLANGMSGTTYLSGNYGSYNGGMIDMSPKSDIVIDSFAINFFTSTANSTYEIWYKTGTYSGNERAASAWTNVISGGVARIVNVSGRNRGYLKIPELSLKGGVTYAFYITTTPTTGNDLYATYGTSTYSNADVSITGGAYIYGQFASNGVYAPYNIDLETYYRKVSCPSARVPLVVTVNPSPNGASFDKSTPFQTTQPNTLGTSSNPDIVANGDQLTYTLTPPKGYINSGYGSKWIALNLSVKSKKGVDIDPSYYTWSTPSGSSAGVLTFKPDSKLTDTMVIVSLQLKDLGPYFCDSTILRHIFVAPRPNPDFKFNQPVCDGDAVVFDNTSSISSGGLIYSWDFGTGNPADTSDAYTTVFTFPTYGVYDVKLKATSVPYGYIETRTIKVVVTEIPKIDFRVVNACEKVAVSFVNNTTHSGTVSYAWEFGDPTTTADKSNLKSPKWTYTAPGGYKVTLKATASGCTSELTKNANQFATPIAKYTAPSLLCDKSEIQFTNGSTIKFGNMGYTWDFGDGGVSNFANPTHEFSTPGTKNVKMKVVSEFGCVDSMSLPLTLQESPKADFSWGAACNLTNTLFTFTGTQPSGSVSTSFNWDFAGEGTTTIQNPSKLFSVVGKKMVTLSMLSNNGCSDEITKEVNVKLQSKADFAASDVCEDDDAVFVNKSQVSAGSLNYNWKFGDASNSSSQSPRHRYAIGGISKTFNVTLVALVPGGCSDSVTKAVSVNANPNASFTYSQSGRLVYFKANEVGATLYQWRFGDGGSATIPSPQYQYIAFPSGKYTACLAVVNAAGCFSETCQTIAISGGVDKLSKLSGVKVYPNPNKGNFTVTVEDPKSDISISVYNLLGELVKNIETNSLKSTYAIDLNVANGIYMVKVTNGGLTSTQKVTVNK